MDHPPVPPATTRRYDAIAAGLAERAGVNGSSMFGMPTLKLDGKALAGIYGDSMIFKLSPEGVEGALRLNGAHLFDPSGKGRPMKAWVVVPPAHAAEWEQLALRALSDIR